MLYGYEIREKETGFLVGDDGEIYYYSKESAMNSAKRYLNNSIIPDEYDEQKTEDDFEISIKEIDR